MSINDAIIDSLHSIASSKGIGWDTTAVSSVVITQNAINASPDVLGLVISIGTGLLVISRLFLTGWDIIVRLKKSKAESKKN
jgi:hypothetical protein